MGVSIMEDYEKQLVISFIGIIITIVVGVVAWQSYGVGAGTLSAGIVLVFWMGLKVKLFHKNQNPYIQLLFGIASLITVVYGVYLLAAGSIYAGILAIISALIIVAIIVMVYLYITKEEVSQKK